MTTASTSPTAARLRWWMRGVGAFYLGVLISSSPPLLERLLPAIYPHLDLMPGAPVAQALADAWWLLALGLGVLGATLLHASRDPLANLVLVRLVVAWEVVVGIIGGVYFLARGLMDPLFTSALTMPSIVIVASGLALLRASRPRA